MGHWGTCPSPSTSIYLVTFEFRAAQTLILNSIVVGYLEQMYRPIISLSLFIVILKLFSLSFVPLLAPSPGDATEGKMPGQLLYVAVHTGNAYYTFRENINNTALNKLQRSSRYIYECSTDEKL